MTIEQHVIEIKNVSKTFNSRSQQSSIRSWLLRQDKQDQAKKMTKALVDINLSIKKGENLGIIGKNGSGKSTLLHIIMGTIEPDKGGEINRDGKLLRLALGMGIDKNLTARDNIYVNGSILGLSFKKIGSIFDEILIFAGLQGKEDIPVKYYSKGMRQRLLFSIAINADADVFLLDEFFGGVGDLEFKRKSNDAFKQKIIEGHTLIVVSHSMSIIKKYCDRTIWIDKGKIRLNDQTDRVIEAYQETYA